jgi:hypothetical protein
MGPVDPMLCPRTSVDLLTGRGVEYPWTESRYPVYSSVETAEGDQLLEFWLDGFAEGEFHDSPDPKRHTAGSRKTDRFRVSRSCLVD